MTIQNGWARSGNQKARNSTALVQLWLTTRRLQTCRPKSASSGPNLAFSARKNFEQCLGSVLWLKFASKDYLLGEKLVKIRKSRS